MRSIILAVLGSVLAVGAASAKDTVYETHAWWGGAILTLKTDELGKTTGNYEVWTNNRGNGHFGGAGGVVTTVSPTEMLMTSRIEAGADPASECRVRLIKKGRSFTTREDHGSDCSNGLGAGVGLSQVLFLKK